MGIAPVPGFPAGQVPSRGRRRHSHMPRCCCQSAKATPHKLVGGTAILDSEHSCPRVVPATHGPHRSSPTAAMAESSGEMASPTSDSNQRRQRRHPRQLSASSPQLDLTRRRQASRATLCDGRMPRTARFAFPQLPGCAPIVAGATWFCHPRDKPFPVRRYAAGDQAPRPARWPVNAARRCGLAVRPPCSQRSTSQIRTTFSPVWFGGFPKCRSPVKSVRPSGKTDGAPRRCPGDEWCVRLASSGCSRSSPS